jgi:hypothetical protein
MARDPKHDILFEPVKIGPKTIRNRFWQTSHCAGPGAERPGAQAHLRGMKAEGGWGAVFTEFCSIHPESDEYPFISARIWDEGDVRNLGYMCEVAHRYHSLAGIQLWYSGGNAPSLESREFGRAPSQWLSPIFATRSVYGCEMDESDIRAVINMYVEAGKRAEQAGFDLLEVSAGDDTLPMQFLEPRFNRRTDAYGAASKIGRGFSSNSCTRSSVPSAIDARLRRASRSTPCMGPMASRPTKTARGFSSCCAPKASSTRWRSKSATTPNGARMPGYRASANPAG